ncbi:hypothetical protein DFJ73DRAFT_767288 [Zopfochytrium polystomum]|nr:hypothetical protein DFJ73DRAFT_767288 [Zopfochytrium polystomum]
MTALLAGGEEVTKLAVALAQFVPPAPGGVQTLKHGKMARIQCQNADAAAVYGQKTASQTALKSALQSEKQSENSFRVICGQAAEYLESTIWTLHCLNLQAGWMVKKWAVGQHVKAIAQRRDYESQQASFAKSILASVPAETSQRANSSIGLRRRISHLTDYSILIHFMNIPQILGQFVKMPEVWKDLRNDFLDAKATEIEVEKFPQQDI